MIKILSICRGIENLSLSSEDDDGFHGLTSLFHALDTLPLTALCLNFGVTLTNFSMVNVNIFARLTHLEIGDADMLRHVDMEVFPMLTHLALWPLFYNPGVNVPGLVKRLLRHATLQVLLFRVERHRECARFLERHALYDPRIVIAASEICAWDDFGRGAMLHWELAEERAKLPGPNHRQHRCFSTSTLINRFRDYVDLDRISERDVDRQMVRCILAGNAEDGAVGSSYLCDDTSDDTID
ncbi:hypothetical protein P692DRAFT_20881980 [Suillus brevipes Sb2]|nr:hypothetical protein P692DRAFT_20881980 [Suillus brevipes Sb2]